MRKFYIRWVLYPYFMFGVRHMPRFVDFAYGYIKNLEHEVQKKLLDPDFIEQARIALRDRCN